MNAPLKAVEAAGKLDAAMGEIGRDARYAARVLALAPAARKKLLRLLMDGVPQCPAPAAGVAARAGPGPSPPLGERPVMAVWRSVSASQ